MSDEAILKVAERIAENKLFSATFFRLAMFLFTRLRGHTRLSALIHASSTCLGCFGFFLYVNIHTASFRTLDRDSGSESC